MGTQRIRRSKSEVFTREGRRQGRRLKIQKRRLFAEARARGADQPDRHPAADRGAECILIASPCCASRRRRRRRAVQVRAAAALAVRLDPHGSEGPLAVMRQAQEALASAVQPAVARTIREEMAASAARLAEGRTP
jgi:hypothetical protein